MSSSSNKGKGGKKLSANKQLLALQDALMLGVSELQLAAQRLGDHCITMSTGTNQEKRRAKDAYAKVKVEVAIELRLWSLKHLGNRKKKENRGKIDSHQARLLQRKKASGIFIMMSALKIPTQTPLSQ